MTSTFRAEAPTWAALLSCYALFAAITASAPGAPAGLVYPALAVVIAFHSSLQHEAMHGHPTRSARVNEALVFLPLGLAYPYRRYRDLHLAHHRDARLTDPYDDPESWYVDPAAWAAAPRWLKAALTVNNCLVGRMVIGPLIGFVRFVWTDARAMAAGRRDVILAWALHGVGAAALFLWLGYCGVSALGYGLACYGGLALINVRSFLEHRAEERVTGRSAIVEDRGPLALLFLNNNYHAVHHAHPDLPWSALPAKYRAHRDRFLRMNGGYAYASYWSVIRLFAFRPKEPPAHPLMTAPAGMEREAG